MSIPLSSSNSIATSELFDAQDRVVLILCGLVASGKSTFAEALQEHYPRFRRCNQDDLGDRRAVEKLARETLDQGLSVCIDRTNFNAAQRSHWINIAREFPGTAVWVIVFDTPYDTCAARLRSRTGHPTIKSPEEGLSVLSRFAADFQQPRPHEGYDRILFLQPSDHPSPVYAPADVAAVLQRVRTSPPIVTPNAGYARSGGNAFLRGNTNGYGGRGRGMRGAYYSQSQNARGRGGGAGGGGGAGAGPPSFSANSGYYNRGSPYRGDSIGLYGGRQHPVTRYPYTERQQTNPRGRPPPSGGQPREDVFPID